MPTARQPCLWLGRNSSESLSRNPETERLQKFGSLPSGDLLYRMFLGGSGCFWLLLHIGLLLFLAGHAWCPDPVQAPLLPAMAHAGRLKRFLADKGYGFIENSDGSGDVFLHSSQLIEGDPDDLVQGVEIAFDIEEDARSGRTRATNVAVKHSAGKGKGRPAWDWEEPAAAQNSLWERTVLSFWHSQVSKTVRICKLLST